MKIFRTTVAVCTLTATVITTCPAAAQPPGTSQPAVWRAYVTGVPIGSAVKLRTRSGDKLSAVLFGADEDSITVKPKTRVPEPSRRIAFADIESLRRDDAGIHWGRAAAIGAGIGAGVFLILLGAAR